MSITPFDLCRTYELEKGILFRDMQGKVQGTNTLSVGTATFAPGRYLPCHRHNSEEVIVVLEGDAFVDVAGKRTSMKRYDSSLVPLGTPHRFVNASRESPLTILWIYAVTDVARYITHWRECMGSQPPEPGEEDDATLRVANLADMDREELIARITREVIEAIKRDNH
jgi:quercetin dioxygenase-like cupin family protein